MTGRARVNSAATSTPAKPPWLRWTCPACGSSCSSRSYEALWGYRGAHAEFHKDRSIWRVQVEEREIAGDD